MRSSAVVVVVAAVVWLLGTWKDPLKRLASACSLRKGQVPLPRKHVLWYISTCQALANTGHEEYSLAPFWAKLAYHLWPTCFQFLAEKHPLQCHFAPPLQSFVPPTALAHRSETLLQGNRNRYNSITITDVEDWYFNNVGLVSTIGMSISQLS